jgi:tetratricopeptide (TPR) repeat protein
VKGIDATIAEINDSLGNACIQVKNYDAAIIALKNALRKNENFADAYFNRGLAYFYQGNMESAMQDIKKALELDPKYKYAEWNYYAGKAFFSGGKYSDASSYFSNTIERDSASRFSDAIYFRGKCFLQLEVFDQAMKDYKQVESLKADTALKNFNYEFGIIYLNSKQPDIALQYFKKERLTDSLNVDFNYAIGEAYAQKSQIDDAIPYLEIVLQSKRVTPKKMRSNKFLATIADDKRVKDLLKKY